MSTSTALESFFAKAEFYDLKAQGRNLRQHHHRTTPRKDGIIYNLISSFPVPQKHRKDVSNFDRQFTSEKTDLTPTDKLFMMNLDQTEFNGFSYLNPEFVQHI